jgi:hypothetical protein
MTDFKQIFLKLWDSQRISLSVVNGQWSMVNGQWSMVNGQWSIVIGHLSFVICHLTLHTTNL